MSFVPHRFGHFEFRILNICFDVFKCACLLRLLKRKQQQIFKIRHVQINEVPRTSNQNIISIFILIFSSKRGIDFGLGRGFSGSQAAKHFMGMAAARYSGGPGKKKKRSQY